MLNIRSCYGYLDSISVKRISAYEKGLLELMNTTNKAILETIAKEQQISDKTEEKLKTIITAERLRLSQQPGIVGFVRGLNNEFGER